MEYVIGAVFNTLQLFAILWFFDAYFVRRYSARRFWLIALGWLAAECVILSVEASVLSSFKIGLVGLTILLLNFLLYEGRLMDRIFAAAAVYALFSLFSYAVEFAVMAAYSLEREQFVYDKVLYTVTSVAGILCSMLFARLLKHFCTPVPKEKENKKWMLLTSVFPASSILILLLLYTAISDEALTNLFAAICLCVMAVANILVLALLDWLKRSLREHEMLVAIRERERQQQESVAALSAAYETQRKQTHDFRKHLAVLEQLLENHQTAQAAEYITQLQEQHTERMFLVNTHHAALDAILNQKGYKAQAEQIDIHFELNDLSKIRIRPTDCTVVLGNLLDNAIEACQKLPEGERWIHVKVIYEEAVQTQKPRVFLSVANASLPVKTVNREIATTKPDASFHGFGLKNVKNVLNQYGAEYSMGYEDGTFAFIVEWPDFVP